MLVVAGQDLAAPEQGRGVVQALRRPVHVADQQRGAVGGPLRQLVERAQVVLDEGGAEKQVLGWVPGDRQLGEGDEVAAGRLGLVVGGEDALDVAVEGPDDGIDLAEGDAHDRHRRRA